MKQLVMWAVLLALAGGTWAEETAVDEIIAQDVTLASRADVPVGKVLYRRANVETVKADSTGKVRSKVYAAPQWDMTGKPLVQYDAETGKIGAKSRYVKFIPDEATAKLEKTQEISNTGVKEFYTVPDSTTKTLSWTLDTDAAAVEWDEKASALTFRAFGGLYMFESPAPSGTDAKGNSIAITSSFSKKDSTLSYEILGGDYEYPLTIDPTVIDASGVSSGYCRKIGTPYLAMRNATLADEIGNNVLVGQHCNDNIHTIMRELLRFDTSIIEGPIDSATVVIRNANWVVEGFYLHLCEAHDSLNTTYLNTSMWIRFKGWVSSGAYSPTNLTNSSIYLGPGAPDSIKVPLNSVGIDEINTSGITQFFMLSYDDITSNAPTSNVNTYLGTNNLPYLYVNWGGGDGHPGRLSKIENGREAVFNKGPVPVWRR